jgi:general secretion pathway protein G
MCLPPEFHRCNARPGANRLPRAAAFTVLEMLVVLAIIGLLVGLGIKNVDKIFGDSQVATTRLYVNETLKLPLTSYKISMGEFPTTSEGLNALVTRPSARGDRWNGPYIDKVPVDHWGEPYQYAFPGTRNKNGYDLWSKGPDRQSGTADDIGNWDTGGTAEK